MFEPLSCPVELLYTLTLEPSTTPQADHTTVTLSSPADAQMSMETPLQIAPFAGHPSAGGGPAAFALQLCTREKLSRGAFQASFNG